MTQTTSSHSTSLLSFFIIIWATITGLVRRVFGLSSTQPEVDLEKGCADPNEGTFPRPLPSISRANDGAESFGCRGQRSMSVSSVSTAPPETPQCSLDLGESLPVVIASEDSEQAPKDFREAVGLGWDQEALDNNLAGNLIHSREAKTTVKTTPVKVKRLSVETVASVLSRDDDLLTKFDLDSDKPEQRHLWDEVVVANFNTEDEVMEQEQIVPASAKEISSPVVATVSSLSEAHKMRQELGSMFSKSKAFYSDDESDDDYDDDEQDFDDEGPLDDDSDSDGRASSSISTSTTSIQEFQFRPGSDYILPVTKDVATARYPRVQHVQPGVFNKVGLSVQVEYPDVVDGASSSSSCSEFSSLESLQRMLDDFPMPPV